MSPTGLGQGVVAGGTPGNWAVRWGRLLASPILGCFSITDCQAKGKVRLNPAYPVPSRISENTSRALKQGLDLHHVRGVLKQPSRTHRSGETGRAGLWVCGLQTDPAPAQSVARRGDPCRKRGVTWQRSPVPVAKPTLAEPKSLRDRNAPSLGWKPSSGDVRGHALLRSVWMGLMWHQRSQEPPKPSGFAVPGTQTPVTRALANNSQTPSGEALGTTPSPQQREHPL